MRVFVIMPFMLKIRLQRVGRKNDASFRVVVTESQNAAKGGNFLEIVGSYDPKKNTRTINGERVKYWMSVGAQPSNTVFNLLISEKIIEGKKINVLSKKSPIKKEGEEKVKEEPKKEAKEKKEDAPAEKKVDDKKEKEVEEKEKIDKEAK